MSKLLSISVASYNAEKYIRKCLESFVIPAIMADIEVIIVNDGSKDSTADIAAEYVGKYPNTFVLVNKENGGHGSTINAGISHATGKFFKIVDSDDWVDEKGFVELIEKLRMSDADAVLSPHVEKYENSDFERFFDTPNMDNPHFWMHQITYNMSVIREHFREIDEKCFYVDTEYVAYYIPFCKKIEFTKLPVYMYLCGQSGQSMNVNNLINRRDQHRRVVHSLLNYYNQTKLMLDARYDDWLQKYIGGVVLMNYQIIMHSGAIAESCVETKAFDEELKAVCPDIYERAVNDAISEGLLLAWVVLIARRSRFFLYAPLVAIMNKFGKFGKE